MPVKEQASVTHHNTALPILLESPTPLAAFVGPRAATLSALPPRSIVGFLATAGN